MVFRGATNDFDPGGAPVAMGCYPQLAWSWSSDGATKRVAKFRGSVRIAADNVMAHAHAGHGGAHPPAANTAGFYADSKTSFMDLGDWNNVTIGGLVPNGCQSLYGLGTIGARVRGLPASWGMVFDYLHASFTQEKEIVGVCGPNDGNFHRAALQRRANYVWPDASGIVQIHAPFSGHSCIHMHWRRSAIAGRGADDCNWYYNGWSEPPVGMPAAHYTPGAPLVPPNQRVKVAICAPRAIRHSPEQIINGAAPGVLPTRNKVIWYFADVIDPAAGQKQVICEHGLG